MSWGEVKKINSNTAVPLNEKLFCSPLTPDDFFTTNIRQAFSLPTIFNNRTDETIVKIEHLTGYLHGLYFKIPEIQAHIGSSSYASTDIACSILISVKINGKKINGLTQFYSNGYVRFNTSEAYTYKNIQISKNSTTAIKPTVVLHCLSEFYDITDVKVVGPNTVDEDTVNIDVKDNLATYVPSRRTIDNSTYYFNQTPSNRVTGSRIFYPDILTDSSVSPYDDNVGTAVYASVKPLNLKDATLEIDYRFVNDEGQIDKVRGKDYGYLFLQVINEKYMNSK